MQTLSFINVLREFNRCYHEDRQRCVISRKQVSCKLAGPEVTKAGMCILNTKVIIQSDIPPTKFIKGDSEITNASIKCGQADIGGTKGVQFETDDNIPALCLVCEIHSCEIHSTYFRIFFSCYFLSFNGVLFLILFHILIER